jgi:hypothetical protein
MPLQPVFTDQFQRDLQEKLDSRLRQRAEVMCERLRHNPTGAGNSHRLKHSLSCFRAADIASGGRGQWRIIFGLHGEHPDVLEGQIVFFFVSAHYK